MVRRRGGLAYDPGVEPTPTPAVATALDRLLPTYDVRALVAHATPATVERVAGAIRQTRLPDAPVAFALEAVRHLGRLTRFHEPFSEPSAFEPGGVTVVDEPLEIVHAFRGQPWPGGVGVIHQPDRQAVLREGDPTIVRALLSIRCAAAPYGTLLVAETRVAWGARAKEPFLGFWEFAQYGSTQVRRSMLAAIARRAERSATGS